jgi:hypothetical protein
MYVCPHSSWKYPICKLQFFWDIVDNVTTIMSSYHWHFSGFNLETNVRSKKSSESFFMNNTKDLRAIFISQKKRWYKNSTPWMDNDIGKMKFKDSCKKHHLIFGRMLLPWHYCHQTNLCEPIFGWYH